MHEVLLVAGMALVTFAVRYPVMAALGRLRLPDLVLRSLRYVAPAVLTAIVVPGMLFTEDHLNLSFDNAYLAAGVVAALVSWRTQNLLLTIVLGMAALWGWRAFMNLL